MRNSSKAYLRRLGIDLAAFLAGLLVAYVLTDDPLISVVVAALLAGGTDLLQRRRFRI